MAMMKSILLGVFALVSVAQAAPLVVTVTDIVTQTHWETLNCTSTVWRPINKSPVPSTFSVASNSSVSVPAPAVISSSTATSVYVASVSTTSSTIPAVTVAPVIVSAPIATTPVQAAAAVVTTLSISSSPSSAKATSTPVARADAVVQASVSADCEGEGDACVGDITHWDGGLGACGWSVDTENDMSIALPVGFMGAQSNGNPYCGRSVTLLDPTTGVTMQATVGDKCMGCVDRAIDTTNLLFNAITSGTGDGRVSGIQWWFT